MMDILRAELYREGEILISDSSKNRYNKRCIIPITQLFGAPYRVFSFLIVLLSLLSIQSGYAQYTPSQIDPLMKWSQIHTKNQKIVFPRSNSHIGLVVASYLDTLSPYITRELSADLQNFPVIIHTTNILSNGMVTYAPKRMELYSLPSRNTFATQWLKQLVTHEYRHVAQLSSLNVGFTKGLSYVLGQQAPGLVCALVPGYYFEGDAVLTETIFSTFGRGRQPDFSVEMRALLEENKTIFRNGDFDKLNYNKMVLGSDNHFVPDKYKTGYIMVSAANRYYGYDFWDKVLDYTGRYPYTIIPVTFAFKKYADGQDAASLAKRAFKELHQHWDEAASVEDNTTIIPTPISTYSKYSSPLPFNDTTVIALKSDLDKTSRFVAINTKTAQEQVLFYTGYITARPIIKDDTLYWTEYSPSKSWGQKNNSVVCSTKISTKSNGKFSHGDIHRNKVTDEGVFYVTAVGDSRFAMIGYSDKGFSKLIITDDKFNVIRSTSFGWFDASFNGLSWDNKTNKIVGIILNNEGMWIGGYNHSKRTFERITKPSYVTLNDLTATDGKLYFTSIYTGKDEVNELDLETLQERTLTESRYGTKGSSVGNLWSQPNSSTPNIIATTYTSDGYMPSIMNIQRAKDSEVRYTVIPSELFNIGLNTLVREGVKRGELINLDSVSLGNHILDDYPVKKYRKGLNLFGLHSWAPIYTNVDRIINEQEIAVGAGATVLSQNLLSTMISNTSIGYYNKTFALNSSLTYTGLPVHISANIDYGGGYQNVQKSMYEDATLPSCLPIKKFLSAGVGLSLPLNLSSGVNNRFLSFSSDYQYTNTALVQEADISTGAQEVTIGIQKLNFSVLFQNQKSMSQKNLAPRFGYAAQFYYNFNPAQRDFGQIFGVYGMGYLPGVMRNHSLRLDALAQYQREGEFNFSQKGLFARGSYTDFTAKEVYTVKGLYTAPVAYPNWGLGAIIYFRRVDVSLIGEYTYATPTANYSSLPWRNFYTYGVGAQVYFNLFRIGTPINVGLNIIKNNNYSSPSYELTFGISI